MKKCGLTPKLTLDFVSGSIYTTEFDTQANKNYNHA